MVVWNSESHSIADVQDWAETSRLQLMPNRRRLVGWSAHGRSMLMDSIIHGFPMPKVLAVKTGIAPTAHYTVIDGNERLLSILYFLQDKFQLQYPYAGAEIDMKFSQLDDDIKNRILEYKIDFTEIENPTDDEVAQICERINRYNIPLSGQQLASIDIPSDFMKLSEKLSVHSGLENLKLFTLADRRNLNDVKYISLLLAGMLNDLEEDASNEFNIDEFYIKYININKSEEEQFVAMFNSIIIQLEYLLLGYFKFPNTRLINLVDFYTLFLVTNKFLTKGLSISGKELTYLYKDLQLFENETTGRSKVRQFNQYLNRCIHDADNVRNRTWRYSFLYGILSGAYSGQLPNEKTANLYYNIYEELGEGRLAKAGFALNSVCPICHKKISMADNFVLAWKTNAAIIQASNATLIHARCSKISDNWIVLGRRTRSNVL